MKTAWGLLLTALIVFAPCVGSAVVLNGSFETPIIPNPPGINTVNVESSIGAWTVVGLTEGSVHHISNAYTESDPPLAFTAQDGNQFVDLTGPGNQGANGVQQTVTTEAGTAYTLTFWVGNQDDARIGYTLASSIELSIDDELAGVFSHGDDTPSNITWRQFSHSFIASGSSTTIQFLNATGPNDHFAGLDNVALVQSVPEPTSLLLLAVPLVGMAARRLRRRPESRGCVGGALISR